MKVLVTGGTGFVGRHVVARLRTAGHTVRLLVRRGNSPGARRLAEQYQAEICGGDVLEASGLSAALADTEAVIHLVGIISECPPQTFERVHTDGTRHVLEAAQSSGVRRFIQMSALGTRPGAASRYHQTKWAAEERVRASGLDWTIFRPSIIYGPGDGFVNLFERISRWSPFVPVMGNGRSRFQPVAVADVATCFVKSLTIPAAVRQSFDLCGTEVFTLEQIIDLVLEVTGRRRWKLHLPWPLAQIQAKLLELIFPRLLRRPAPFNRDQLKMLREDNVGNPGPAIECFGIQPEPFRKGIGKYLMRRF